MKKKFGKPISPNNFQQNVIDDVKAYTKRMGKRARKYLKQADVKVMS